MRVRVRAQASRCAVCHDAASSLVRCRLCGTATHAECLAELARCPSLGCRAPELNRDPAWGPVERRRPQPFVTRLEVAIAAGLFLILLVTPTLVGEGLTPKSRPAIEASTRRVETAITAPINNG